MSYSFADQLPDPDYKIGWWGAGDASTGDAGPGFAGVDLTSTQPVLLNRTNSQRVISRGIAGQRWDITIKYHPMTRAEFEPVSTFLLSKQGPLNPFYVKLPQYSTPRNSAWATELSSGDNNSARTWNVAGAHAAGVKTLKIDSVSAQAGISTDFSLNNTGGSPVVSNPTNIPAPGDILTITDTSDTNHTKVYMIATVETYYTYASTQPATAQTLWLNLTTPLARAITDNSTVDFSAPRFKVILPKAVQQYSLNTENLYSFNLSLQEYL